MSIRQIATYEWATSIPLNMGSSGSGRHDGVSHRMRYSAGYEVEMDMVLADPSSLLGQIQRGRGAGFLAALAADPTVVAPLTLVCILGDPRFDRQGDSRGDYYACLAAQCRLPLAPLEGYLHSHPNEHAHDYTDLLLETLASLTWRGDGEAARILVRYLTYGPEWTVAFDAIVGGHAPIDVRALGRVILDRFPEERVLTDEIDRGPLDSPTWDRWAAVEPRVAPLIAALRARRPRPRPSEESIRAGIDPAWDIPTVLAHATHDTTIVLGRVAGARATTRDIPVLLDAFFSDDTVRIRAASHALAVLAAPGALPPLIRFVEEFDANPDARLARYRIGNVRPILAATSAMLPVARAWLHADGWARPSVALSIVEQRGEERDVEPLRALMVAALEREPGNAEAAYAIEGCLDALARFPAHVPYTELARVFERTESIWSRRGAAELMASGHPDTFARAHAIECLWDCAEDIIEIGCAYADLSMPIVKHRLDHLRHSPFEEDGVKRQAAKRRQ